MTLLCFFLRQSVDFYCNGLQTLWLSVFVSKDVKTHKETTCHSDRNEVESKNPFLRIKVWESGSFDFAALVRLRSG